MKRLAALVAVWILVACGGGGGGGTGGGDIPPPSGPPTLSVFAGFIRSVSDVDRNQSAARFVNPFGVATDSAGNVYVADSGHSAIRKVTPAGVVSTLAGSGDGGNADGLGVAAQFNWPTGVATDSTGNVYVADSRNHTIRKITPAGVVSTLAGSAGVAGSADGMGTAAQFNYPNGIATDSTGNVYVADAGNHTIRKITPAGGVSTLAGIAGTSGSADGMGTAAQFNYPNGIATDSAGYVYVADKSNCTIRKITPAGVVSTLAGTTGVCWDSADGLGAAARFNNLIGIATDSVGNVYVADTYNSTIRKITQAGLVSTLAGMVHQQGSADGTGEAARFYYPFGLATDTAGNVYVADSQWGTLRKVTPAGVVSTLAGIPSTDGNADGMGVAARFAGPYGIATDSAGNAYVGDTGNHTIRKITPAGVVSTLAGIAGTSGSADGMGPAARFSSLSGIATDSAGNVYVADEFYGTIRKITPDRVVSTLAGYPGGYGSADGTGAAARFRRPRGIATDSTGNVYVADSDNHTIRKITPTGMVSTLAGTAGLFGSADGIGATARFNQPVGIAIDSGGNAYVVDGNGTIRKITPAGVVSTLAGIAKLTSVKFQSLPMGIATDSAGNVYVADSGHNTIRKFTPAGIESTLVGAAGQPYSGFVAGPLPGALFYPKGLAISGSSLYITTENGVAVVTNLP